MRHSRHSRHSQRRPPFASPRLAPLHTPLFTVLALLALALPAAAEVKKAVGRIELTGLAGDCAPIHSSKRDYPGLDVVKLALESDGKQLAITATLKDPPDAFASEAVRLYFDTDNNPRTGAPVGLPGVAGYDFKGFELKSELDACVSYDDHSSACVGGSDGKPIAHYAEVNLERFKGADYFDRVTVVDLMGMGGRKAAPQVPIAGKVVRAALDYADLNVKPGQTIHIVAEKVCGYGAANHGFFPEILLTLK